MKPEFSVVKEWFLSWGLAPSQEAGDEVSNISNADGECIINVACYERMRTEALQLHGEDFSKFVGLQIDATDGAFYLICDTWTGLEESYNEQ